jgi:hypothetical protein
MSYTGVSSAPNPQTKGVGEDIVRTVGYPVVYRKNVGGIQRTKDIHEGTKTSRRFGRTSDERNVRRGA